MYIAFIQCAFHSTKFQHSFPCHVMPAWFVNQFKFHLQFEPVYRSILFARLCLPALFISRCLNSFAWQLAFDSAVSCAFSWHYPRNLCGITQGMWVPLDRRFFASLSPSLIFNHARNRYQQYRFGLVRYLFFVTVSFTSSVPLFCVSHVIPCM